MMPDLHEKWTKFNEDRISQGKPSISFVGWINEHHKKSPLSKTIKYLELDSGSPNRGTQNKKELMKTTLTYLFDWGYGPYSLWISKLSNRLGLSKRTVRENYIDPLIEESIIIKIGSQLYFVGPQEEVSDEQSDTKK